LISETRYARVDDLHLADQTLGDGAIDIVLADQWTSHQEAQWDVAPVAEVRRRLAQIGRLFTFDKRGVGMSDPVPIDPLPSIEAWIDDVRAVWIPRAARAPSSSQPWAAESWVLCSRRPIPTDCVHSRWIGASVF